MASTSTTVTVKALTVNKQEVKLIDHLARVIWQKIRFWRGLRRGADVTPIVK